ncbi:hypothetical protein V5799_019761 [Amblyomma americanum]|uniref:Ionotropic glutamate receptor C-terminal domain-containing protein n=1 Tax=Amblyomma americanum TaxID=6943 RepID=A0AAQ4EWA0_AMBAM
MRKAGAARAVVLVSVVAAGLCSASTDGVLSAFLRDLAEPPCSPSTLVVLWLSAHGASRSPGLLKTLTFPVQQWTAFGEHQMNELKAHVERNKKIWVLAPGTTARERKFLMEKLNTIRLNLSLARFVFELQQGEQLLYEDYPEVACILVGVNSAVVDVAVDGSRQCSRRRTCSSVRDFCRCEANDSYRIFNGRAMTVVTDITTAVNVTHNYERVPESLLLLSTLKDLNASVVPYHFVGAGVGRDRTVNAIHRKAADLSLFPAGLSEDVDAMVDIRAINGFRSLVFFSRKSEQVPPRIMHTILSSGYALAALTCCGFLVLGTYACQKLLGSHTSVATCLLFLVSNLVGRGYPPPAPSGSRVTRILVLFWALGVLSFCAYLQSVITSEVNVPAKERKIRNTDDLLKYAKLRQVLPCLELGSASERFIKTSTTDVGRILRDLLDTCGTACVNTRSGMSGCVALAQRGTHVYVRTYDSMTDITWSRRRFRLAASEDRLRFMPTAPMIPKGSAFGPALKRLVVHLLEHGHLRRYYSVALRKRIVTLPPPPVDSEEATLISFWDHFLLYAWGTVLACVALLIEIMFARLRR